MVAAITGALIATSSATETHVGVMIGDVVAYGGSTGTTGTTGSSGTTGATGTTTSTWPAPSCPGAPCLALTRTTGFQLKVGSDRSLMTIPANGSIVAWTITLSSPTTTATAPSGEEAQVTYFDDHEGGTAQAGIAILKPGKHLYYTLVSQSPVVQLEPYFGETVEFPLASSIHVKKGEILALTVPTWAPVMAADDAAGTPYGKWTSWRSSRQKSGCQTTGGQTAQQSAGSAVQYYCMYEGIRLAYSALEITTP